MTAEPPGQSAARLALFELYAAQSAVVWVGAAGSSMRPWIPSGASILVDFGARSAALGEVAVYRRGTLIIAHRVVAPPAADGGLATKGDGQLTFDGPVAAGDLLGVVRAVRSGEGSRARRWMFAGRPAVALARGSRLVGRAALGLRAGLRLVRRR
jgi:hypothetical protein